MSIKILRRKIFQAVGTGFIVWMGVCGSFAQTTIRPTEPKIYQAQIVPHWFAGNTRFWYRNDLRGGAKQFILVNVDSGKRAIAFDAVKLASALSQATEKEFSATQLPFSEIEFSEDAKFVQFEAAGKKWNCDLNSYECSPAMTNFTTALSSFTPQPDRARRRDAAGREVRSPDEQWLAFIKDNNVFIRSLTESNEFQLSENGKDGNAYSRLEWSPDSQTLVGWRVEPGERKTVYLLQSSPPAAGRAIMRERPYAQPGDKFARYEVNVFDIHNRQQITPEADRFEHEYDVPRIHWSRDQTHFAWMQEDRGHQRLRVIEVDCQGGAVRNIVDEKAKTFIWTAHAEVLYLNYVNWLTNSDEMIYVSEMDGWRHFYLVDTKAGKIKNQITRGEWVVRGLDRIDEAARQIWFRAGGMNKDQDPYFVHYYRVNFDGTGLVALTEGNGNHTLQFSPNRQFILDTYSRVDMPPVNELRSATDGKLVCKLEQADASELTESGWQPPEVFVAKGRDGKTDIWGIIQRPAKIDPAKKYPVLENIYNGPQAAYVPKSFSATRRSLPMTDAGFVVVQMDAMGTAFRSKAFHDVCWHDLADAGLPDRIAWIKAAGDKYPYLDLTRVGIFGTSAGGQNAAGAVLFHPEFYKAAVANCGCHDNRIDKASWNEQWMGYMVLEKIWSKDTDNWYARSSNIDNAAKLRGKLFLIVGEMDDNVPPESTLRFVDALTKARKDFEMLVVPGANHGANSPITQRRTLDFFKHHLMGVEPPDRNNGEE